MQTYLAATDLSERGARALRRGFQLARQNGARLLLVCVIDDNLPEALAADLAAEASRRLDRLAEADPDAGAVAHEARVLRGDPAPTLAEAAQGAALTILGVHRPRPFADAFLDTTMQRIARLAPCPVLTVRDPVKAGYARVLGAVDFSPASAAALRAAASIAPGARIAALHALHIPYSGLIPQDGGAPFRNEARAAEAAWRASQTLPEALGSVEIAIGGAGEVLRAAGERYRPDLLTVGAHARAGVAARVLGSFATALMRDPPCDLLVAKPDIAAG